MKRLVSLVAMVLTLTMVLSLAACGNDDANPDQPPTATRCRPATPPTTTRPGIPRAVRWTWPPCAPRSSPTVGSPTPSNVETDALNNLYGIDRGPGGQLCQLQRHVWRCLPPGSGDDSAVDASAASDIAAKLESRLNTIAETAALL